MPETLSPHGPEKTGPTTRERGTNGTETGRRGRDPWQLRTITIETGKGLTVIDACRKLGITEQTYYRWKNEDGGLRVDRRNGSRAANKRTLASSA